MRFIGVDPGANYTGVAVLEDDGTFSAHREFGSPLDAWRMIYAETRKDPNTTIILEDLLGSGRRDSFITKTLKVVGYLYWRCIESVLSVILVPNQRRIANVQNVPDDITGKDERAAAAHALTARERWPHT